LQISLGFVHAAPINNTASAKIAKYIPSLQRQIPGKGRDQAKLPVLVKTVKKALLIGITDKGIQEVMELRWV